MIDPRYMPLHRAAAKLILRYERQPALAGTMLQPVLEALHSEPDYKRIGVAARLIMNHIPCWGRNWRIERWERVPPDIITQMMPSALSTQYRPIGSNVCDATYTALRVRRLDVTNLLMRLEDRPNIESVSWAELRRAVGMAGRAWRQAAVIWLKRSHIHTKLSLGMRLAELVLPAPKPSELTFPDEQDDAIVRWVTQAMADLAQWGTLAADQAKEIADLRHDLGKVQTEKGELEVRAIDAEVAAKELRRAAAAERRVYPKTEDPDDIGKPVMVSVRVAAEHLGVGKSTIHRLIKGGQLSALKIRRRTLVRIDSLDAMLGRQPKEGKADV